MSTTKDSSTVSAETISANLSIGERLRHAESALAEAEQKFGPQNVELLPFLDDAAQLYLGNGLFAKAELMYRRAADLLAGAGDQGPQAVDILFKLGTVYRSEGKLDDAESVYLRALSLCSAESEQADLKRVYAERLCCLAGLFFEKQQFAQTEELLTKAIALFGEALGPSSYSARLCSLGLALLCCKSGKSGESREHVSRAAYPDEKAKPHSGSAEVCLLFYSDERAIVELAQLYFAQNRLLEVEQLLMPLLFSPEERLWSEQPRVAQYFHERGELFRAQRIYDHAQRWFEKALEVRLRVLGNAHSEVAISAFALGIMLLNQKRHADAEPLLKLALKTRVRAFGVEHPSVAACIETYSTLLKSTKRTPIAQKLDARARDIRTKLVWQNERSISAARPLYPSS